MAFGISYTLATPVFGYMVDRGKYERYNIYLFNIHTFHTLNTLYRLKKLNLAHHFAGFSKFWAMVLGNILIAVAFIFLGPSPPLDGIIGQHVWLHILSLISQGKSRM